MNGKWLLLLGALALGGLVPQSLAAQLAPVGPEVRVDTRARGFPWAVPTSPWRRTDRLKSFGIIRIAISTPTGVTMLRDGEPTDPAPVAISRIGENLYHPQIEFATAIPDGFQVFILKTDSPFNGPSFISASSWIRPARRWDRRKP